VMAGKSLMVSQTMRDPVRVPTTERADLSAQA
jgi:hypothetical protein